MSRKITRTILEKNEQATFIEAILYQYRNDPTFLRPLFFSTLNGAYLGGNGPAMYQRYKKEGFVNGVADILYLQPRGRWSFMAIELKTEGRRGEKDGGLSEDQRTFLDAVSLAGGLPSVCYGAEEALEAFGLYMSLPAKIVGES